MSFVDILKAQSVWTYDIMAQSADLGEMIREDAITSVNLATIQAKATAEELTFSTTSLQGAHLEKEFGGDWIWNYNDVTFLIQAKKLDAIKGQNFHSYKIDVEQLKTVIYNCESGYFSGSKAIALYVFYNTFIPGEKANIGCIAIAAKTLWKLISDAGQKDQKSATVSPKQLQDAGAAPWWKPFS